ncbi:hypothetical protein FQR65_LT05594 [Abscondita terminalis]|nr:hypothetical protein FQR65_LT05594 [Abscondita terminalis]
MADHYDVTPVEKNILLERAKRRTILREEFLKLSTDPFRHASAEGGTVGINANMTPNEIPSIQQLKQTIEKSKNQALNDAEEIKSDDLKRGEIELISLTLATDLSGNCSSAKCSSHIKNPLAKCMKTIWKMYETR